MNTPGTFTDVPGLLAGHTSDPLAVTGCTAILCPGGAVAGVEVRGWASGVAGLDLLDPRHVAERIHGVVLAGGSAFGLEAVFGVMAHLEAQGIGFATPGGVVPLVVGAILYDLSVGDARARPDRAMGQRAAAAATRHGVAEGSVGAGTGASVGKLFGMARAMKGGLGTASRRVGAARVGALVAVNAFGDVRDPASGALVAGARDAPDGHQLVDAARALRAGAPVPGVQGTHTTIGVVATDARLTKAEARRLAGLAHLGLAAVLSPPHTTVDGDTLFCLSTGDIAAPLDALGLAAADCVAEAVVRGVRAATSLGGLPAWRDLATG
ncbi:MAG: P1 family peptidase [Candidatus Rokubacteria bacterium]|nr:P1 family peptidase [Candidatus Rokubacteria bacterium]